MALESVPFVTLGSVPGVCLNRVICVSTLAFPSEAVYKHVPLKALTLIIGLQS